MFEFVFYKLVTNPEDVLKQVALRFGRPANLLSSRLLFDGEASVRLKFGDMTSAIALLEKGGPLAKFRARWIHEAWEVEKLPIIESCPLPDETQNSSTTILFYLTNSKPYSSAGYSERSHYLLQSLGKLGISVRALTRFAYPLTIGRILSNGTDVIDDVSYKRIVPARFRWSAHERLEETVAALVDEARAAEATVLHTTTPFANAIVVSRAASILGIPWVYETRGEPENTWLSRFADGRNKARVKTSEKYETWHLQELSAVNSAAGVVSLSEVQKKQFVDRGANRDKINVIPNSVDAALTEILLDKRALRKELGIPEAFYVGAITSVVDYEGLDCLIEALTYMPMMECLIVGDGEALEQLKVQARVSSVSERVHFIGKVPEAEVWKWYGVLDVLAIPRKDLEVCRKVTPIKGLKAMALGVPVIASDLPALREVTGGLATYVPAGDPASLAQAILRFEADQTNAANVASSGRGWAKTRTWRSAATKLAAQTYKIEGFGED